MKGINLSFSACGFLGIYHLGAASALCRHGQKLLKDVQAFAGASAGSLVASVLLTAPEKLEECGEFTYVFAEEIRRQALGAATPGYDFMARLRSGMESILPPDAHTLACGRLHVSITNARSGRNCLVSAFCSREDLLQVLCASSFVPIYAGLRAVEYRGQALLCAYRWKIFWMGDRKEEPVPFETTWRDLEGITLSEKWVDGGLTDSLPILPGGRTVTVSPFTGRLDISPQDDGRLGSYVRVANQDVLVSHHVPGCLKGVRLLRCPTHLQNGGSSLITFVHTTSFIYGTCLALVPPDGECEVACSSVMVCAEASSVSFFLF
ncbi:patatin-like phospholipase domain-containing protein 4 isoform X3 [Molossus molossus]|uniref:patatin-like phospholipase domain-containing protein 4 isoform X3 n=1 Tax=Molossus molossus TaxID=27622 RepID=UPI001745EB84|nr:patatin-like phospholipase domain-containing protein 4 isoform X3 [Molossus molossus]